MPLGLRRLPELSHALRHASCRLLFPLRRTRYCVYTKRQQVSAGGYSVHRRSRDIPALITSWRSSTLVEPLPSNSSCEARVNHSRPTRLQGPGTRRPGAVTV